MRVWGSHTKPIPRGFPGQVHAELTGLLRQHCPVCDERHLVLLGRMITGLLLSQTVCFDQWKRSPSASKVDARKTMIQRAALDHGPGLFAAQ